MGAITYMKTLKTFVPITSKNSASGFRPTSFAGLGVRNSRCAIPRFFRSLNKNNELTVRLMH